MLISKIKISLALLLACNFYLNLVHAEPVSDPPVKELSGKSGANAKVHKIDSILTNLETVYKEEGVEKAQQFASTKGVEIKKNGKISVCLVYSQVNPFPDIIIFLKKTYQSYNIEFLSGVGNLIQADIPINMVSKIANEIDGIEAIRLPERSSCEVKRNRPDLVIEKITYKRAEMSEGVISYGYRFTIYIHNIGTADYIGDLFISNTTTSSDIERGHYSAGRRVTLAKDDEPGIIPVNGSIITDKVLAHFQEGIQRAGTVRFRIEGMNEANYDNNTYDLKIVERVGQVERSDTRHD